MSRLIAIVNPASANGKTGREWQKIESTLERVLGHKFETCFTEGQNHATEIARESLTKGTEIVIVVGGDGTVNEVVNGFMGEKGPLRTGAALAYIPRGTGCDFVKTVSIPRELDKAMDLIDCSQDRLIDLGKLKYRDHNGRPSLRYFHNITSFGLGGEVDERVNRSSKACGGFISFIWATLISILTYDKKRIHLKIDNGLEQRVTSWNVVAANGQYHGGGMWVAPDATVDDGLFHVIVIGDLSLPEVFWNLPKLYTGKILQVKKVSGFEAKRVEAYSDQRVLLDVDGEQLGQLPVVIEMVPGALPLIMPS